MKGKLLMDTKPHRIPLYKFEGESLAECVEAMRNSIGFHKRVSEKDSLRNAALSTAESGLRVAIVALDLAGLG